MSNAAPLLAVDAVTRQFGGVTAVDNVSFTVQPGELLGIIGPNGAGKTTLFNLISGFVRPSSGRISFAGQRIDGLPAHRIARLGMSRTFQNLRIYPGLSVYDNVSAGAIGAIGFPAWRALVPGAGSGRARQIAERTGAALRRVGLAEQAQTPAGSLSYGQRKYLEIARALATQPRLLVLDEPAAGLNAVETESLAGFIAELNAAGTTLMLVEHDMGLVMGICRRVVVLAAGAKIADEAPGNVQADPAVQAAYLGAAA